jgi:hypothetical protein
MKESTAQLAEVTIEQQIRMAREGIPAPMPPQQKPHPKPGKPVADKDAL